MKPVPIEILNDAIAILGDDGIDDNEIDSRVSDLVDDPMTVRRLVDWPPEAFGLVLVSHGWRINPPETFSAKSRDGKWREFKITCEPVFADSVRIAQEMRQSGPIELFKNVALRSAVLNTVNKALNSGAPVEGSTLGHIAMIGIPAEVYRASSKPFWRRLFS